MSEEKLPELGKIPPAFFDRVIYPKLGAVNDKTIIGPQHGVDFGVVRFGRQCMAVSTDPFFIVPSFGFAKAAWFAFHIIVCDVAVSGLVPSYLAVDLNLPPEMKESELEEMWDSVHTEAANSGVTIITGHTARYTGCTYPMVGGGTSIAIGKLHDLRCPSRARIGDKVVITKGPAIETTGLLAVLFPEKFITAGGESFQQEAAGIFSQMSVLQDCAVSRKFKGVHVMHDATEYGIWGGLHEMARAGGFGLRIDEEAIPVQPVIRKTADLFKFDPYSAISEGTLIICVDKKEAGDLTQALRDQGITAADVGQVAHAREGMKISGPYGLRDLEHPEVDPYWILAAEFAK